MARQATLAALAAHLDSAAGAADWTALARADQALATALPRLAALGPWSTAERSALAHLRERHAAARRDCDLALAEMGELLAAMRGRKDGWLAYAETGGWPDAANGAH
ncbi:MAG TPA: hypothetical protein VLA16_03070 [Ideonella sp.]|nr:hypothetical protein [Ideonella sp.]